MLDAAVRAVSSPVSLYILGEMKSAVSVGVGECCKWMGTRIQNLKENAEFKVKLQVGSLGFFYELTNVVIY